MNYKNYKAEDDRSDIINNISNLKYRKEDDKTDKELFEKDFFFNHNLQIDEQSNKINNLSNQNIESTTFQNNVNNVNNPKINYISNQFYNNSNRYHIRDHELLYRKNYIDNYYDNY